MARRRQAEEDVGAQVRGLELDCRRLDWYCTVGASFSSTPTIVEVGEGFAALQHQA